MTTPDDLQGEMHHSPDDDRMIDLLLGGRLRPEDCPPDLAPVAVLVHAARQPATGAELAGAEEMVAGIAAALASATPSHGPGRSARVRRMLGAKAVVIGVATLLGATAAAAATGSLPDAAQSTVASALGHVGVDVPAPSSHDAHDTKVDTADDDGGSAADEPTTPTTSAAVTSADDGATDAHGPDATGPARFGLCTAAHLNADGTTDKDSVPFRNLQAAAAAAGQSLTDFCNSATPAGDAAHATGPGDDKTSEPPETEAGESDSGKPAAGAKPAHSGDDTTASTTTTTTTAGNDSTNGNGKGKAGSNGFGNGNAGNGSTGSGSHGNSAHGS